MLAVIMSVYKQDKLLFVQKAIDSIVEQTYNVFDFYILYDGPVEEDIKCYIESISVNQVFIYKRLSNRGLAISLNELLNIILEKKYEYIARMDADDISLPTRFEKQIDFLTANLSIDCVGTWAIEINSVDDEYFSKQMPITHADCFELFRKRDCMIHPTVMFRRSYFEKAGLYPEDTYFGEDTLMWAKGFQNGCHFANLPEFLFKFRLDDNFFQRRRGWKHAKSIFNLRHRVNSMLGFGFIEDCYALLYAIIKMMPVRILNFLYKNIR